MIMAAEFCTAATDHVTYVNQRSVQPVNKRPALNCPCGGCVSRRLCRQDHISNHRGRHLLPKKLRPNLKIHPTKISKVGTFSLKQVLSSMPTFISWYLVAFELLMSQEWHSAYFCTGSWKFILSATCCIAQYRLKTWQIYRWIFAHNLTYTCPNDLNDLSF